MEQDAPRSMPWMALVSPGGTLCLLVGIVGVQWLPALPPLAVSVALIGAALAAALWWPRSRGIAIAVLGAAWAMSRADLALDRRLSRELEGRDIDVVGIVQGLPDVGDGSIRFELVPQAATLDGVAVALEGTLRVSWYREAASLAPCERWQLRLRLKRPRGLVNPGGFDTERHALENGVIATGYVRDDGDNRRLATAPLCIDGLRDRLSNAIGMRLGDATPARLMRALAVGDQRNLDEHDWQVLRATGVGHLIAISGFHVGLLAGFGALLMRLVWKIWPRITRRVPGVLLEAPAGFVLAMAYAALAGFGLPTTRTLLMIAVVSFATLRRRALVPTQSLALALATILVVDPLAVLSAGFWLSFIGVTFLMLCLGRSEEHGWRPLVTGQGAMSVGLLPLSIWFFGSSSLAGPLANLVAVPLVSFVVVPLVLAGCALLPFPIAGGALLNLAAWIVHGQWWLLDRLATLPGAQWFLPAPSFPAFVLALLGVACLLLPRGIPARWLGAFLLLPLLWPLPSAPPYGVVEAAVLDVGQGLAVLVRTRDHALLYDAGARYLSGFNLGEAAVVPAAHAFGVDRIDRLIVSHGDNDHVGGATAAALALTPQRTDSGEPERLRFPSQSCNDERWHWNGVAFHLFRVERARSGNDRSCVLLVDTGDARLLLPGDISESVEPEVAKRVGGGVPLALVVPHHGSRTSSSSAFLDVLGPQLALVSAGYRSRFGHPHPEVVARYTRRGIPLFNTADAGCLRWRSDVPDMVESCRAARRYWREP